MPRGGRRVGAGRKPRPKPAVVLGMNGARLDADQVSAPADDPAKSPLLKPPAELTPKERACWKRFAGHAIEQRTLVPATVAGFR